MDSKTLIKALKIAVRDVIKEELTEILREGLQSTINEMTSPAKRTAAAPKPNISKPTAAKTQFKESKWASILNETPAMRENNPNAGLNGLNELLTESYNDLHFTSKDAQGFGMMREAAVTAPSVMEDPESGKVFEVDPIVAKAMTRDYSALMKAIEKKKGN